MPGIRYRRGGAYAADMARYAQAMAGDNSEQLSIVKRNLVRALQEDVTPRQREVLLLYYGQRLNTREIGEKLGVSRSTVARTIKRGRPGCAAACATVRGLFSAPAISAGAFSTSPGPFLC